MDDIDSLDVLLVAPGSSSAHAPIQLRPRPDLVHPRIDFARRLRDDVQVLTLPDDDESLVILGTGLGGLTEVSIEIAARQRGAGLGRSMLQAARSEVPDGEPIVAMVAPGSAASLRTFLAAGFTPLGSAQLWHRA